jgi:hypothetical protein
MEDKVESFEEQVEEQVEEENKLPKKFIAVIPQPDGDIGFNVQGMDLDEAFILMKKAMIRFEKLYDTSLRNV